MDLAFEGFFPEALTFQKLFLVYPAVEPLTRSKNAVTAARLGPLKAAMKRYQQSAKGQSKSRAARKKSETPGGRARNAHRIAQAPSTVLAEGFVEGENLGIGTIKLRRAPTNGRTVGEQIM